MNHSSAGKTHSFATLEVKTEVLCEVIISVAQEDDEHRTRRQGSCALTLSTTTLLHNLQ